MQLDTYMNAKRDLLQEGQKIMVVIRDLGCFLGLVKEVSQYSFSMEATKILSLIDFEPKINPEQAFFTFKKTDIYVGTIIDINRLSCMILPPQNHT